MIYSREKDIVEVVADQTRDIEEIKQTQVIGYDNIVVKHYVEVIDANVSIAAGTYAEYTATFTYDNPPSSALAIMTFDYTLTGTTSVFATEYTPALGIDSTIERKFIFRFVSISGNITHVNIGAHTNCTEDGTLTLVRTL